MTRIVITLILILGVSLVTNASTLTPTGQKVINYYKKGCQGSFDVGDRGITHIHSDKLDIQVTVISTANMTCNGRSMGYCGSSGCSAHMVTEGRVYDTNGGVPFLVSIDPFVIGWWTSGYRCDVKGDRTIANATSCMLVAVWDEHAKRLRYPHGGNQDSWLNTE